MKNRISIKCDEVKLLNSDEKIIVSLSDKFDIYDVTKINIFVKESTSIEFDFKCKCESKYDIAIELDDNVCADLFINKDVKNIKVQYKYYIKSNCTLNINKFYECKCVRELDLIYLNGVNSKIYYDFKTLGLGKQKYDIMVYHNFKDTASEIKNKGVSIGKGNITFNVTGIVYKGIKNCNLNQNNKIVNMNDVENIIKPVLIIDEQDVVANHSAYIGKFDSDEIFYMTSRGINELDAIKLLLEGFLRTDNIDVAKKIDKYWR